MRAESPVVGPALRERRGEWASAVAAGVGTAACALGLTATSAWLIVRAAERPAILSLTVPMGLVQLFALARAGGRYAERTLTHRAGLRTMGAVRARLAALLEPLIPAGLGPRSADVVDAALADVDRVQELLTAVAGPLLASLAAGLGAVAVSGLLVAPAALSLAAGLALVGAVVPATAARAASRSEARLDRARRGLVALFDDAASAGAEYALNGSGTQLRERLDALEGEVEAAGRRLAAVRALATGAAASVTTLATAASLVLTVAAWRAGHLDRALLAVPPLLATATLELVAGVAPAVAGLRGDAAALARLDTLGARPAPVVEPAHPGPDPGPGATPGVSGLALAYGERVLLAGASARVRRGRPIVVSGPSGSGKTALARVLARLLDPAAGAVDLDGVDYRSLLSSQVREHVGLSDDEPYVFATSLAANLRVARPDATDDDLADALGAAGLSGVVASLVDGLATELGGVGPRLSGGERRRLGVAREVLADRPVALFDEPTEGLDDETGDALTVSLADRYRDRALVIVTHRGDGPPGAEPWRVEGGGLRVEA